MNFEVSLISNWIGFLVYYYYALLIIPFVTTATNYSNQSFSVELFVDKKFTGHSKSITSNDCVSLQGFPTVDKKLSSLKFPNDRGLDSCVNLFKTYNCSGDFIRLDEDAPSKDDLALWGNNFEDEVSSLSPCLPSCHSSQIQKLKAGQQVTVNLYEHKGHDGPLSPLHLKEGICYQVPITLNWKASSMKVDDKFYCIQIYVEWNCTGRSIKMNQDSRNFQEFVGFWGHWLNDRVKAISLCGYSCIKNGSGIVEGRWINQLRRPTVDLFSEFDFGGLQKSIALRKSCYDIRDSWDGQARSIDTFGTCVHLYDTPNCMGRNFTISNAQENLDRIKFKDKLRSLRVCGNVTVPEDEGDKSRWTMIIIYVISGLAILFILTIFVCYWKLKLGRPASYGKLTEYDIQEFFSGSNNVFSSPSHSQQDQQLALYCDAYDRKYEIDLVNLDIDTTSALGYGQFGIVFRGKLKQSGNSAEKYSVAVKTLKPFADGDYVRALLREIKVMIHVGNHSHILELIGCCTANLNEYKLYVVTSLCEKGNLEKYLRNHKESFADLVTSGRLSLKGSTEPDSALIDKNISTSNLLKWSVEIAKGMAYLEGKKVIHGDMAARNILLDEHLSAKVSDFGLSKKLYEYSQYVKKKDVPLPWRWLAIESMKIFEFSTKSDVWAYGVTMWEIFSLGFGDVPYPSRSFNDTFMSELESGYRLPKPKFAPNECHTIMLSCWQNDPENRPTFNQVIKQLEDSFSFLTSTNKYYMG